jgi:hypothetical protein
LISKSTTKSTMTVFLITGNIIYKVGGMGKKNEDKINLLIFNRDNLEL